MDNSSSQKLHWNKLHQAKRLDKYSHDPTDFAREVIKLFPTNAKILELGCGLGNDTIFFAQNGYFVLATDFSDEAIKQNQQRYSNPNLNFKIMDISKTFPLNRKEFDVVYARLSLHYFSDLVTRKVFKEIYRILKPSGLLCFMCKSTNDPLYGKGKKIEEYMFIYKEHIRHFFNEDYIEDCLGNSFKIESMESGTENLYGDRSAFVKVVARKI